MTKTNAPRNFKRHRELADVLIKDIETRKYRVGERFPTELDIQQRFGVGRHTAREALKILAEYGLIGRRRKTGSVVLAQRPVSQYVHSLRNFRGLLNFATTTELNIRHIGYIKVDPSGEFAGLSATRLLRVAGVRTSRSTNEPICWAEIFIPGNLVTSREEITLDIMPIYDYLARKHRLKLAYVEQDVSAVALSRGTAETLNAQTDTAGLLVKRRYVDDKGMVFELSSNLYPASRYSLQTVIRQRA